MAEKKKRFMLFNSQREGRGVEKPKVDEKPGFKRFFRIYRDNFFSRFLYINIIMIIGNLPIIFWVMALVGVGQGSAMVPNDSIFSTLFAVGEMEGYSPASLAMISVAGVQSTIYTNTFVTYLFWGLGALTLLTWGFVNTGTAYVLRNIVTGRPVFILSDCIEIAKKNWKQALIFGIFDLGLMVLLPFNIYTLSSSGGQYLFDLFFWVSIVIVIMYVIMRWYIYLQIVSFSLGLRRIIKNALYFVMLGIKRNILALLGNIVLVGLSLLFLFGFGGYLIALALFIPALMLFSNCAYMGYYAAWYKIDEIMVIHDNEVTDDASNADDDDEEADEDGDDETKNEVVTTDDAPASSEPEIVTQE